MDLVIPDSESEESTFHEKKKVTPTPSTLNDLSTQFDGSVHLTSLNHSNSLHLLSSSSSYPSWVLPGTLDHPFLATTPSNLARNLGPRLVTFDFDFDFDFSFVS
ncbi:hypothetical protein HMI55_006812 [Coelomomyces lativittatus]|nr:hypothetical protein HMI55_006812 [Coelomomyces lativittatus]